MMQEQNNLFQAGCVYGIPVNISHMEQALQEIGMLIASRRHHYVCFLEGNLLASALREKKVYEAISGASLIYPDGISVAQKLGSNLKESVPRVSGPTFLLQACQYGLSRGWRHFFLGGAEGVAEKMAANLKAQYPGLAVAGCYTPPFREMTETEEAQVKQMIETGHTDLLWVGLGGPKQEFWMQKHLGKINVPLMLGIGAAFDFHSHARPWAPPIVRKLGLEWLFRMFSGDRRTFFRNLRCCSYIFCRLLWDNIRAPFRPRSEKFCRNPLK